MSKHAFAFPLSFAQERLWFFDRLVPSSPLYNLAIALRLNFPLDASVLERSLNEIVKRHEILRTTFVTVGDGPAQIVAPSAQLALGIANLETLQSEEREAAAVRIANLEAQTPFDIEKGPLLRATLLTMSQDDYVFVLVMHHIVSDAWSVGIFFQELNAIYPELSSGGSYSLPDLPIQYADFAIWQRDRLKNGILERQLKYWKEQLSLLPQLELPTDHPRPAVQTFAGDECMLRFSKSLWSALIELSRRQRVTLFMTLLAAFQILLSRYSGQEDFSIGTPIAGRSWAEIEKLIGFFVNTLVLRADLSGNPSFEELLQRVRATTLEAYTHQELPFELLVSELGVEREPSRNPLFQVMFQLRNTSSVVKMQPMMNGGFIPLKRAVSLFDLAISLWETQQGMRGTIEYSTDLFEPDTIARLAGHYEYLLQAVVTDPRQRLSELHVITPNERERVIIGGNDTSYALPEGSCFHTVLESQAMERPDTVAIEFKDSQKRYGELDARANKIAHYLRQIGVLPEVLVGVYMGRSSLAIESMFGIMKAGGVYLPLDPSFPIERTKLIVRDAKPLLVLAEPGLECDLADTGCHVTWLDKICGDLERQDSSAPIANVDHDKLAYVIYTSGSTGIPKGVLIRHLGLLNVIKAQQRFLSLQSDSRILRFASPAFDASIFEIALAIGAGATLCIGSAEELIPGAPLAQFIKDHKVTAVVLPPSALAALSPEDCTCLTTIMVAGEVCSAELVARWAPSCRVFNLYGPTEATIWTTIGNCTDGNRKPSIGKPIDNMRVYLLDRYQQPVPIGVPGEIYISGPGVARGYLNRPDETAKRFVRNPFCTHDSSLLYRSGDVARLLANGDFDFMGRLDDQVKIRGFRVELGEIEEVLRQYPSIQEAVVIGRQYGPTPQSLVAYILPREGVFLDKAKLREFLQEKLPEFMVPSVFVLVDHIPRLPSGKVDRSSLRKPDVSDLNSPFGSQRPQTEVEQIIAGVWCQILGIDKVGIHDNFFELGGTSLQLAMVHAKLAAVLETELTVLDLFRYPTIYSLAKQQATPSAFKARDQVRGTAKIEHLATVRKLIASRRRFQ